MRFCHQRVVCFEETCFARVGIARHDIKVLEDDYGIMKAMCDKAMDKAIRVG
jgi:hypothetical protein